MGDIARTNGMLRRRTRQVRVVVDAAMALVYLLQMAPYQLSILGLAPFRNRCHQVHRSPMPHPPEKGGVSQDGFLASGTPQPQEAAMARAAIPASTSPRS